MQGEILGDLPDVQGILEQIRGKNGVVFGGFDGGRGIVGVDKIMGALSLDVLRKDLVNLVVNKYPQHLK